jgi:DNA-binding protein Fis
MCANGVKKRASDISGLSLSTIGRKLKEYKIS